MTDTNQTKNNIVNHLNLSEHEAHVTNTVGIKGRRLRKRSLGIGDVLCCWKGGLWLEIEVKTGNDRQSEVQKKRQERIQKAGGIYIVIETFDEYLEWYEKMKY